MYIMNIEQLLKNKYVLYAVLFVALSHVLGYLTVRNYRAVTLFVSVGLLTTYFTKNMIVTLLTAIVFTNLFATGKVLEGITNNEDAEDEDNDIKTEDNEEEDNTIGKKKVTKESMESIKKVKKMHKTDEKCPDGKCNDKAMKDAFTQQNVPSSTPAPATESEEDEQIGKRIDYAATLEHAYDNLQGILGAKGMDGLTKETQKLIDQQSSLMKTLNTMTPVLNNAKSTLDKFDLGTLTKSLGSLQSLVGKSK